MDYRASHKAIGKGKDYDNSFAVSDYRQFILDWEIKVLKKIISDFAVEKGNYLDFACGTARITSVLENYFSNSFGVDVSGEMLKEAKKKVTKAKLIQQDITKDNPFDNNQMDLITAYRFFLNAESCLSNDILKQLHDILRPDGYLVFNIHNKRTLITIIVDILVTLKKKLEGREFYPQKSLSIRYTKRLLREQNFKVVKTYHKCVIPILNENTKFKISKFYKIENFFSRISFGKYIARNVIFVCKKTTLN